MWRKLSFSILFLAMAVLLLPQQLPGEDILDKKQQLARQTFWDNRDEDWFNTHIPFFECPDEEINTTYYYRWELLTKHLTYGSPNSGYSFTEFIDRPPWSGTYGAISCPAGHQIYEARWLRDPMIARDFGRYWLRTPGAQPRNYSTWLADALWALHMVHPHQRYVVDLLPDLRKNYAEWEQRHFVPEVGLFWQTGHDDGMEYNINSRQTGDLIRGAPGYRPTLNAYLWADARAIAHIAGLAGKPEVARAFETKANSIKQKMQSLLWDEKRAFFLQAYQKDEQRDGHRIKALSKTYETGKFAGSPHGRELMGYVPWQFDMPDQGKGYERAWKYLMDRDYFYAPFGPSTVERHDPQFLLQNYCCWWSGQSWPYATTQTLKALANLLQRGDVAEVSLNDYYRLLHIYASSHRKQGQPYLAEALHPDTGSFEGHDGYNHSEHYFHSGFCDLVITGLVGLRPRPDDLLEIFPLASPDWDYYCLDGVVYRGRQVCILWDKTGSRYQRGAGWQVLVDGKSLVKLPAARPWRGLLPPPTKTKTDEITDDALTWVNHAVNNDGDYYPRLQASHTGPRSAVEKIIDGNYWYHLHPPNRWTAEGSANTRDFLELDFAIPRKIDHLKLYFLDDGKGIVPPRAYHLETWRNGKWEPLREITPHPTKPQGRRALVVRIQPQEIRRLRLTLEHAVEGKSGLTEWEVWGQAQRPVSVALAPPGNLAHRAKNQNLPKVLASYTSRFDKIEMVNDGKIIFAPNPHNRWTTYDSPNASDWLEVDWGETRPVSRVELYIYDDRGGVQAPQTYQVQYWDGQTWRAVTGARHQPARPTGGVINTARFTTVNTAKIRVLFIHAGAARSGLTEIEVWRD